MIAARLTALSGELLGDYFIERKDPHIFLEGKDRSGKYRATFHHSHDLKTRKPVYVLTSYESLKEFSK